MGAIALVSHLISSLTVEMNPCVEPSHVNSFLKPFFIFMDWFVDKEDSDPGNMPQGCFSANFIMDSSNEAILSWLCCEDEYVCVVNSCGRVFQIDIPSN